MRKDSVDQGWENYKSMALPEEWFISDDEKDSKTVEYKGWVYRQYGKRKNEIPCFMFNF